MNLFHNITKFAIAQAFLVNVMYFKEQMWFFHFLNYLKAKPSRGRYTIKKITLWAWGFLNQYDGKPL